MNKSFHQIVGIFLLGLVSIARADDASPAPQSGAQLKRAADAEGIAVMKLKPNLLHGSQSDPTPWECEPSLLYAAKYPLSQRDSDFLLDYCSVLSLAVRGRLEGNYFDVANAVAGELPNTQKKLQRYRDASQYYLEVSSFQISYAGTPKHYLLAWQLPRLPMVGVAIQGLANAYVNQRESDPHYVSGRASPIGVSQDYRRFGGEYFARKYGATASVSLNKPAPWPNVDRIMLNAADDKTEYALETLTNNVPMREIDGTFFHQLELTGNLVFTVTSKDNAVVVTPLFLEAWMYKHVVRIPLNADSYALTCKTSGLFGRGYKCE